MAIITGDAGGSGGPRTLAEAAAEAAEQINAIGEDDGRCWVATVTDASLQASIGIVYASIGTSVVEVIAWRAALASGDKIIVKKFDNSQTSAYVLLELAAQSDENVVEYGLDFPAPMTSSLGTFYAKWGGTIVAIQTTGAATFALTVGGAAKTVGSTLAAGDWVLVTATAAADTLSGIAVMVG